LFAGDGKVDKKIVEKEVKTRAGGGGVKLSSDVILCAIDRVHLAYSHPKIHKLVM
jgi:hypothetical protein